VVGAVSRRRIHYRTPYRAGPYRIVALALRAGFAIIDESRPGRVRYATTRPHPAHGHPIAATYRTIDAARRMLARVASIEE
jgi:hypothetical protein